MLFDGGPKNRKLDISNIQDQDTLRELAGKEYTRFNVTLIFASLVAIAGVYFIYIGVEPCEGSTIKMKIGEFDLELNNALPGVAIIFGCFFLLALMRPRIKIK